MLNLSLGPQCVFLLSVFLILYIHLNGDSRSLPDAKLKYSDEEISKAWKLTELNKPSQLRSLRLPDCHLPVRVSIFFLTPIEVNMM